MATTIALLNPGAWMKTGWKCKGKMPSCSLKQQVTSINFPSSSSSKLKYVNNNQRWLGMAQYHPITTNIVPTNTNLSQQDVVDVLFTADKPPPLNFVDMLSRILASVFTFFIIIIMASNSALAASYGRMGGSSSPRSSSQSSSRRSSPSLYLSNSYHDADHYSISSSTCTCGGNSEVKHTCTCDPNCTHCNCDIEEKGNKQLQEQSTHRSCSCNCHKTCYFHKKIDHSHAYVLLAFIILGLISVLYTPPIYDDEPLFFSHNNPHAETVNNHQPTGIVTGIMFQLGVSDKERKLQRKLNKIAENADTSTLNGLNYILKEVVGALVQHDSSSFLFSNCFAMFDSMEIVSEHFQKILNMELDRYDRDEDTLVNVDGVKYKKKTDMVKTNSIIDNEYTVATIMVLATGKYSIPYYKNKEETCIDCVAVLQTLQSIPKNKIQSIEVFWSPQREEDVLLEEDLRRDFPLMASIKNGHIFVDVIKN